MASVIPRTHSLSSRFLSTGSPCLRGFVACHWTRIGAFSIGAAQLRRNARPPSSLALYELAEEMGPDVLVGELERPIVHCNVSGQPLAREVVSLNRDLVLLPTSRTPRASGQLRTEQPFEGRVVVR